MNMECLFSGCTKKGVRSGVLKEADGGAKVIDVCRKYGISDATYYNWRAKYHGMEVNEVKRLK